jgi:RNA polymerase primary sigma factor
MHHFLTDEAREGQALIAQMASQPLLGRSTEEAIALDLARLRSLIAAVQESAEGCEDAEMAAEYTRQLHILQDDYTKDRDTFFYANTRLVLSVIAPMSRMEYMDMFQFGCIGLMRAIEKFDPSFNTAFSTYATRWIKQAIQRGCDNEESLITLPVHTRDMLKSIRRYTIRYTQEHGRPPDLPTICDQLGLSYKKISHIKSISATPFSLNKIAPNETQTTPLYEFIPAPDPPLIDMVVSNDTRAEVVSFIRLSLDRLAAVTLDDGTHPYAMHAAVIRSRYRIGEEVDAKTPPKRSLKEVGILFDLDPDQVRQLQRIGVRWIAREYRETLESFR